MNLAVTLKRKDQKDKQRDSYAIVEVPTVLPRFLELPVDPESSDDNVRRLIPLEEVLKLHAGDLFSGTEIVSIHGFTIVRNSDLSIEEVSKVVGKGKTATKVMLHRARRKLAKYSEQLKENYEKL